MEDKMFEMLTKMYGEINEIKANMATKQEMQQGFFKLENIIDENHKALYDGYKQSIEGINELRSKVDKLTDQVEHQEIRLQVIKGSK